ncbi:MAG: rod shape-determining protein RodA [Alphaproteobacteria bacterium]|nr:MAG: rod shape-determining protein RodA [Alphaproteobacteria bacterium]
MVGDRVWNPADRMNLGTKLALLPWGLVGIVATTALIGIALLYSAGGQSWQPWAGAQALRLGPALVLMLMVAVVDARWWLRAAYPLYGAVLAMLVGVAIMGQVGGGAQRWLGVAGVYVQPSELMKLALILALARYFHGLTPEQVRRPWLLIPPLLLVGAPVVLVLLQPNLGTATLLLLASMGIFFLAGVPWWFFISGIMGALAVLPVGWHFLHDYQKARLTTFLNPAADPLGSGYNILQSQIALGAGGLFGKGFGLGSQSQLQFLPEKHTDFIFVVMAEEFGFIGAMVVVALYVLMVAWGMLISLSCSHQFGRLVGFGIVLTTSLYLFVNVSMVMGLIPVVGIPLPLVSYGGSALLTLCLGIGLLLGVAIHRHVRLPRGGPTGAL